MATKHADGDQSIDRSPPQAPPSRQLGLLVSSLVGIVLALGFLAVITKWLAGDDVNLLRRSLSPILTSALFLLLGLSAVGLIRYFFPEFSVKGDVLFVAILLAPIVAYLILAGQVSKVSAPGVLEVTLTSLLTTSGRSLGSLPPGHFLGGTPTALAECPQETATAQPETGTEAPTPSYSTTVPLAEPVVRGNGFTGGLHIPNVQQQQQQQRLIATYEALGGITDPAMIAGPVATEVPTEVSVPGRGILLPFEVGRRYDPVAMNTQVAQLSQSESFKFVVFVVNCTFLVADIPAAAAPEVFRQQAAELLEANATGPDALKNPTRFPAVGYDTITDRDTALSALERMGTTNIDALLLLDANGNIVSVVTRQQIESGLIRELATRAAQ